jgi:hypothetical protein
MADIDVEAVLKKLTVSEKVLLLSGSSSPTTHPLSNDLTH